MKEVISLVREIMMFYVGAAIVMFVITYPIFKFWSSLANYGTPVVRGG